MFYRISDCLAEKFVKKHTIHSEEKEVYRFGIQQGLTIALNLLTTLVIGLVFQMVLESFLFLAVYIPLRSFAGGAHAKTANRCYIYSSVMIIAVLLVIKFFPLRNFICDCLSLISGFGIFLLAPVETEHKKLDDLEKQVYRKRTRVILVVEVIVQLLLSLTSWNHGVMCFTLAFVSLCLVMLAGIIKNRSMF